jgi:cytochrome c oxidase subunit 3
MFFGALFCIYCIYRSKFQDTFSYASQHVLNVNLGALNTVVLLTSSLTMALAVHFTQLRDKGKQIAFLVSTILLAVVFLVVKAFEWSAKAEHHLIPGKNFVWNPAEHQGFPTPQAHMFFNMYFGMTGLHALHVVVGIIVIGALVFLAVRRPDANPDWLPTHMVGLYWHFVDIVWIFLFPLFYLIPHK